MSVTFLVTIETQETDLSIVTQDIEEILDTHLTDELIEVRPWARQKEISPPQGGA